MGDVGDQELQICAYIMVDELGRTQARKREDIEAVKSALTPRGQIWESAIQRSPGHGLPAGGRASPLLPAPSDLPPSAQICRA